MNLVIGATGMVGGEVCRLLRITDKLVRAMVRKTSSADKVKKLHELEVQVVHGDLRDRSTFAAALRGVSCVIATSSSMPFSYIPGENDIRSVDSEGMMNFIDAAAASGVSHFIYTSFSGNMNLDFPLHAAKRKVEKHLMLSGMTYTILRPSCFMEVWLTAAVGFDPANGQVQLCGVGDKPVSYISYRDVARFAVECVNHPAARNAVLELGGPEALSQLQAIKLFKEINDRQIAVQSTPEQALLSQLQDATDPMQKSFAGLMLCVAKGDSINMSALLRTFPLKLTSVHEYIRSVV